MAATRIDGKAHAALLCQRLARASTYFTTQRARAPGLAVVLVGEDPASQVYVRNKVKQAQEVGIRSFEYRLQANSSQDQVLALLHQLNADVAVDGILVQLPLPPGIDSQQVLRAIDPTKDVDGFHPLNVGLLATGSPIFVPCTPLGCLALIQETLGDITGARALVIGRSNIVGKPMAQLLLNANATPTIAHARSQNLAGLCQEADIVVVGVGKPHMVRGDWLKAGACVIDVGINRISTLAGTKELVGDVAYAEAVGHVGAITPVPGGVGPMTIACLLSNTLRAASLRTGIRLEGLIGQA
jgi:methylenetetrahydrofolate dehydrogenase (NADP+) / methenyltetrahydrofolate cyclohydrolase